jgi:hypothetical protein
MQFPYAQIKPGLFGPIVRVEIQGDTWMEFEAFVDTGASFSIFHAEVAKMLNIKHWRGKLVFVTVGDGGSIPVYEHRLKVRFSEKEFFANIGFSSRLGVGVNLIGREDFFEKFRICFNDRDKVLETTPL